MVQRMFGVACFGVVAALAVAGCAADVDEGTGTSEEALKTSPCALVRCAAGTHCEVKRRQATCVLDPGSCAVDTDCRLFSDYCTGCDCRALNVVESNPTCAGPGVRCFADPCGSKYAQCAAGVCVVRTVSQ